MRRPLYKLVGGFGVGFTTTVVVACAQLQGLDGFEKVSCLDDCPPSSDNADAQSVVVINPTDSSASPDTKTPGTPDTGPPRECNLPTDCASGVCTITYVCASPTCTDKVKNGTTETDVDCGGTANAGGCPKCGDGKKCLIAEDCSSSICDSLTKLCAPTPTCTDGIKNGAETATDCGGPCAKKCAVGQACAVTTDCDGVICDATSLTCRIARSCNEIKAGLAGPISALHIIDSDGSGGANAPYPVYCDMTGDGGGWTLVLKADGTQTNFAYDSALWTDANLLNAGMASLDLTEAKLQSFNDVPFTAMRVGIVDGTPNVTRWVVIPQAATSLKALMTIGVNTPVTTLGRDTWKALMANGGSLQLNCNAEGFNADPSLSVDNFAKVRIGILGNQEDDCTSPDSWIGLGGQGDPCNTVGLSTSVGNVAGCEADNGDMNVAAFGYVMVR